MKRLLRITLTSPMMPLLLAAAFPVAAQELATVVVTAAAEKSAANPARTHGDTATLLKESPGLGFYSGGGVSSLPVIHGLADDRIKILVDGMEITSACANHMNPALSYIDPARVAKISALAGITPVSAGGDSIAGSIVAESAAPAFATRGEGTHQEGSLSAAYRSNSDGARVAASAWLAGENLGLGFDGAVDHANDYQDGNGNKVRSTLYESRNQAFTLAVRGGPGDDSLIVIRAGEQGIPYQGFPNQRMDMTGNHATFLNLNTSGKFAWGRLDARAYWQDTRHEMNFLAPDKNKSGLGMPMLTHGRDIGYALKAELPLSAQNLLRLGHEFHRFTLDDWWPPVSAAPNGMMSPDSFWNIAAGRRDRASLFAEIESQLNAAWTSLVGLRSDVVSMEAGRVQGYSRNAMARYGVDADAFNAQGHGRRDGNWDFTALFRSAPDANVSHEVGYARKTRSPNLYERYAWSTGTMASNMVNWFGDANGYVGNPNLRPEVAHTLAASAGWRDGAHGNWEFKATPYATFVKDYIGADKWADNTANFALLRFVNHDARIHGLDLSGKAALWDNAAYGRGELKGMAAWTRGTRADGGSLYHIVPLDVRLGLEQQWSAWTHALEVQGVAAKTAVDTQRKEAMSAGYALVNLRASYRWRNLRLDAGIDNLFNKFHALPLGGVAYADWRALNNAAAPIWALPGPGRSFNIGATLKF